MKIKIKGIDFEIYTKSTLHLKFSKNSLSEVREVLIVGAKYQNLEMNSFEFLKFYNIINGFVSNILGNTKDPNFDIIKKNGNIYLRIQFRGKSVTLNKITAMNLSFILKSLLSNLNIDIFEILKNDN